MTSVRRVAAVTGGLIVVGAVGGALAAIAVATPFVLLALGPRAVVDPEILLLASAFGAPLGALLLPIAGWLLMRQVPIGRAIFGTVVGTILGGIAGWFLPLPHGNLVPPALTGAIVGFAVAVLLLRDSVMRRPTEGKLG